ncbi:MAG: hypothetical protein M5U34_03000 [Chloroflexi bacterium]|nr:hypothetical protein [Chloroflexota bacterium]
MTTAINADQVAHILLNYVQAGISGSQPQLYLPGQPDGWIITTTWRTVVLSW